MSRGQIVGIIVGIAAAIFGAAVKLGNFTNVHLAWLLIAVAAILAIVAIVLLLAPCRKRLFFRWPVRIVPKYLLRPNIYPTDRLELEFLRLERCFDELGLAYRFLKLSLDRDAKVERKIMEPAFLRNLVPPVPYGERLELEHKYHSAKVKIWRTLDEFREVFSREVL